MLEYLITQKKRIILTYLITAIIIPSSLFIFLIKDGNLSSFSLAILMGLAIGTMVTYIPYMLNKSLMKFVNSESIQIFLTTHFEIKNTVEKTDKYNLIGKYKGFNFELNFHIDNRQIKTIDIGLKCEIDFVKNKDKKQRKEFIKKHGYIFLPNKDSLGVLLTFEKNPPSLKELIDYSDKLIQIANANNFNITK